MFRNPPLSCQLGCRSGEFKRSCKRGAAWKPNLLVVLGSKNQKSKTKKLSPVGYLTDPELSPCDRSKQQDGKKEWHRVEHLIATVFNFVMSNMCNHVCFLRWRILTCPLVFFVAFDDGQNICQSDVSRTRGYVLTLFHENPSYPLQNYPPQIMENY